eukprot:NODE_5165_length_607_cov_231.210145.p4 GENE.NODE_5165_length_607_cov_231.210145~~NODE_5165_length_607_cov_231.210145.p4  ORF type:complete len:58 (+),score=6.74 NODE_5165_length_607_cov_231.210145:228-401(+)
MGLRAPASAPSVVAYDLVCEPASVAEAAGVVEVGEAAIKDAGGNSSRLSKSAALLEG